MVNLRIPGPTPCPEDILQAGAKQMINHRGPEFEALLRKTTGQLKQVFETKNDLYQVTSSGTGIMETAVVNTLSPGDNVLSISIGVFGTRFGQIAEAYGAKVVKLAFTEGTAADLDKIKQSLKANPDVKAVLVTHNETSTGVTNDIQSIARAVKESSNALLLVDGISSVGCIPLPVDKWGCDVVVTGSQKGFMVPPGLAFISFNDAAWKAYKNAKMPRFYFDIGKAKSYFEQGQTPFTPAVSVMYALDTALDKMLAEGMDNIHKHHKKIGDLTRKGVKSLGLTLLADEKVASNTVTAVNNPPGVDGKKLLSVMRQEHEVVMAGGQGGLIGKIFRIGHLGHCSEEDIDGVMSALQKTLPKVGFAPSKAGVKK